MDATLDRAGQPRLSGALGRYLARRVGLGALVVIAASVIDFALIELAPGGPEVALTGPFSTVATRAAVRAQYHLGDPLPVQYLRFALHALRGDLGTSFTTHQPVGALIWGRLGISASLVLGAFALIVLLGTGLGALAAYRRGEAIDRALVTIGTAGAAIPGFAAATLAIAVFAVGLGWLPVFGAGSGLGPRITHLLLPVLVLAATGIPTMLRVARASVLEVLGSDHVAFAAARGVPARTVFWRSVLRGAGVQVLTQAGALLLFLLSAELVIELVFDLDGLGALFVAAVKARDVPVVQGVGLLLAVAAVAVNLLVDLLAIALDPRIRAAQLGAR